MQTKASHTMTDESDAMSLMTSEYSLERSKLEASKAQILSEIQGAKNRIDVGMSEGSLDLVKAQINSHKVSQQTELQRLQTQIDKANRDLERTKGYLGSMILRAPTDGVVNILSNFRSGFSGGQQDPPFKEGDSVWTGAAIAEIPDLSSMRVEVKLDEVDRGKIKLGQIVKVRVDAIPDKEFEAVVDWISPIAALSFRGMGGPQGSDKLFPAYATLKSVDPRLRLGMSASVDIHHRKPAQRAPDSPPGQFHPGREAQRLCADGRAVPRSARSRSARRNDEDIVVVNGLRGRGTGDAGRPEGSGQEGEEETVGRVETRSGSRHAMKKLIVRLLGLAVLLAGGWWAYSYVQKMPQRRQNIPVAKVRQGDVVIRAFTRGELRAIRSEQIIAPNLMGTVQVTRLAPIGAFAREKDLIVEFDDSEVLSRLEEDQLGLESTDQSIKKSEAELAIRNNQDQVDLLTNRVRRTAGRAAGEAEPVVVGDRPAQEPAELWTRPSRAWRSSRATSRPGRSRRRRQLALLRQQRNRGVVRDGAGAATASADPDPGDHERTGFDSPEQFRRMRQFGAQVPDIREGDQVQPGMPVADVLDLSELEVLAKIGELDRANLVEGQEALIELDAVAGKMVHGQDQEHERDGHRERVGRRPLQEVRRGLLG